MMVMQHRPAFMRLKTMSLKYTYVGVLFLFLFLFLCGVTQAQNAQEQSDPEAERLLTRMEELLTKDVVEINFEMQWLIPGEEPVLQHGTLIQQKKQYYVSTDDAEIWCDGTSRWVLLKEMQEVNIYSATEEDVMTPMHLLASYSGDQFISGVVGHGPEGTQSSAIELKPVDRRSDIAKVRVVIKQDGTPLSVELFEKTATRITLKISAITFPLPKPDNTFVFDKRQYPGIHVEDLRID